MDKRKFLVVIDPSHERHLALELARTQLLVVAGRQEEAATAVHEAVRRCEGIEGAGPGPCRTLLRLQRKLGRARAGGGAAR